MYNKGSRVAGQIPVEKPVEKGGKPMSTFEALMIAITFATLVLGILKLSLDITKK